MLRVVSGCTLAQSDPHFFLTGHLLRDSLLLRFQEEVSSHPFQGSLVSNVSFLHAYIIVHHSELLVTNHFDLYEEQLHVVEFKTSKYDFTYQLPLFSSKW